MGLALSILAQASALDALDAWEARLREVPAFAVTIRKEAPGVEPSILYLLRAADGRFRLERQPPEGGARVTTYDGRRVGVSPYRAFSAGDPERIVPSLVRVGLALDGCIECDLPDEYTIREIDGTHYELERERRQTLSVIGIELEIDPATSLARRRHVRRGDEEWTEVYEWDLSPTVPPDAFDVPRDFGVPERIEQHPWVPEPHRASLALEDASLLAAAAELIEVWNVPVVVCPTVAKRRGSVSVENVAVVEAAWAISRAWEVAVQFRSGTVQFLAGDPPIELARGMAGPFGLRVTAVESAAYRPASSGERRSWLTLTMAEDRVPGAAAMRSNLWCRSVRDDQGRELELRWAWSGNPPYYPGDSRSGWSVQLDAPARDARWITIEGTISVVVPEGSARFRWEPGDGERQWEAAEGRLIVLFYPGEVQSGSTQHFDVRLRPREGFRVEYRSLRVVRPEEWWPSGDRVYDLVMPWAPAAPPLEFDICWGERRIDLPFRIDEVPLP